jgi:hypothetical protein
MMELNREICQRYLRRMREAVEEACAVLSSGGTREEAKNLLDEAMAHSRLAEQHLKEETA